MFGLSVRSSVRESSLPLNLPRSKVYELGLNMLCLDRYREISRIRLGGFIYHTCARGAPCRIDELY